MSVGLQAAVGGFAGAAAFYLVRAAALRWVIWRLGRQLRGPLGRQLRRGPGPAVPEPPESDCA